ncbi:MAG: hypothetical protein ACP5NS_01580 [Candidatus Pacearchaeota archaeon]
MKTSGGWFLGVATVFVFLLALNVLDFFVLGDGAFLAPLSTRNFCLDRDGFDIGTANVALEYNIPNSLLVQNGAGGFTFDPTISGIVLTSSSGGVFGFDLTTSSGQTHKMQITLLADKATSATRTTTVDTPTPSEPGTSGGTGGTSTISPGTYTEWFSSAHAPGGAGMMGPISSPGAPGVTSADDQSYEAPCKNKVGKHNNLAGTAPVSITITFAGPGGNLPITGSATGASVNGNALTFQSSAGYVRAGTSP